MAEMTSISFLVSNKSHDLIAWAIGVLHVKYFQSDLRLQSFNKAGIACNQVKYNLVKIIALRAHTARHIRKQLNIPILLLLIAVKNTRCTSNLDEVVTRFE